MIDTTIAPGTFADLEQLARHYADLPDTELVLDALDDRDRPILDKAGVALAIDQDAGVMVMELHASIGTAKACRILREEIATEALAAPADQDTPLDDLALIDDPIAVPDQLDTAAGLPPIPDIADLKAHPAADVWPLLSDDEIQALADSITSLGLLHPIVAWYGDADGFTGWWLLDGRNRRDACVLAGIDPDIKVYDGDDPALFVLGENEHRRHATASQRAMAVALTANATRENGHTFRKNAEGRPDAISTAEAAARGGTSTRLVESCRYVKTHAPDLVDAVLTGTIKAAAAEAEARRRVRETERLEREQAETNARAVERLVVDVDTTQLTAAAPDLAERWNDEDDDRAEIATEWEARTVQAGLSIGKWIDAYEVLARILPEDLATLPALAATRGTPLPTEVEAAIRRIGRHFTQE